MIWLFLFPTAGVGFSYGSLVGLISQLRGNENGVANHALAAFLAFAPAGAFAKSKHSTGRSLSFLGYKIYIFLLI